MNWQTWVLAGVATASVLVLATVMSFFAGATPGEPRRRRAAVVACLIAVGVVLGSTLVVGATFSQLHIVSSGLELPVIGMTALGTAILSLPARRLGFSFSTVVVFSGLSTLLIVLPVQWAVFTSVGILQTLFRTIDLAGALPALCAPSVAALTVLAIEHTTRSRLRPETDAVVDAGSSVGAPIRQLQARSLPTIGVVVGAAWLAWIGWMVGSELALDDVTRRIIVNGFVTPIASIAAWLVVQRMVHRATTRSAVITGMASGLAAITPACGYVDAVGAAVIGLITGAIGSAVAHALARRHAGAAWLTPSAIAIGSSIGVMSIGLFSTRVGVAYTGQPELLFSQVASLAVTALYSAVVAAGVWLVVRRLSYKRAASVVA